MNAMQWTCLLTGILMQLVSAGPAASGPPPDCFGTWANGTLIPGILHLDARHYPMGGQRWQIDHCKVVGQPGTLITNGSAFGGGIFMSGTLRFEDVSFSSDEARMSVSITDAAYVTITRGNIYAQGGLQISGSSVSLKDSSIDMNPSPLEISTSEVYFESTSISIRMTEMYIDDSIASFHRSNIYGNYHCPQIRNSTLSFVGSSAWCSDAEEPWSIRHSILKLTQSQLMMAETSSRLEIEETLVNATCTDAATITSEKATVTNSTLHFANCTCQMSHGIAASGSLSITGGSMTYGKCEKWTSKMLPASMLV
jgi:hypothetical protein